MEPTQPMPDGVKWWLCSHLVSVVASDASSEGGVALLEEISATGVRLVVEEPIAEGSRVCLRAGTFEVDIVVAGCRVRRDDFQVEARFDGDFQWSPGVWSPNHLYRPPEHRKKAKGAARP